jgi:geranylgeranyl diphosphate synthase, type I
MGASDAADRATVAPPRSLGIVARVDAELREFLSAERDAVEGLDPDAVMLVDEIARLVDAGGKRVRAALCYWGHRAADGADGPCIVRAAAALELLHTLAIVHDDVMDDGDVRRGVATVHRHAAQSVRLRGARGDAARIGTSVAVLAGDLAGVYADRLLLESGFDPSRIVEARRRYDAMRVRMAAGQLLDVVAGPDADELRRDRISILKTGSYTVEGPLSIGAALAGGTRRVQETLARYARPLGRAFQARDDLDDGDGGDPLARAAVIDALVHRARAAIEDAGLPDEAVAALHEIAELVAIGGGDGLAARRSDVPRTVP